MVGGEAILDRRDDATAALAVVKKAVLRGIERDGRITPAVEAQVHRAVDLLRLIKAADEPLRRIEGVSCLLHQMHKSLLDGRCNAYASSLLRLRRSVDAW